MTDLPSPGGWLQTYGLRIARGLVIGVAGVAAGVTIFGTLNGGQAIQYCEAPLQQTAGAGGAFSCLSPLTESAAVVSAEVYVAQNPSPATRIDIGTASGSTQSGQNIFNNVDLNGASRLMNWTMTGGQLKGTFGNANLPGLVVAPNNYTGTAKRYVTGTYTRGSGQVVGNYAGWVRIGLMPCTIGGVVKC